MFEALNQKDLEVVINAMTIENYKRGEYVIKQGDWGDHLFVCDSGELDCLKRFGE